MKKTNNKGFSLIELIIVIAIMAVLVAIIAPNLTKYLGKSKDSTDKKNLDEIESTLKTCITSFEMDHSDFITSAGTSVTVGWTSTGCSISGTSNDTDAKNIIDEAIDASKTKRKQNTSQYAKAVIQKQSNGTYKITMSWS